jgi:hypothetical protein
MPEVDGYEFIRKVRELPADSGGRAGPDNLQGMSSINGVFSLDTSILADIVS